MIDKQYLRILTGCLAFILVVGCDTQPPEDLDQAATVVQHLLKPGYLANSAFSAAYPDPQPSQFVSYIFSEMGAAEWPAGDGRITDTEREEWRARGLPVVPTGVSFVPRAADRRRGRQVVIGFDDFRGTIVVKGYEDPQGDPVLVKEWALPQVQPAPGVRANFQASLRAGMSYQAF